MKDATREELALADEALDRIAETPPALVRAGRKGIVAAAVCDRSVSVVFRREGDVIRMETWPTCGQRTAIAIYALPAFYQKRAASLIDGLPN